MLRLGSQTEAGKKAKEKQAKNKSLFPLQYRALESRLKNIKRFCQKRNSLKLQWKIGPSLDNWGQKE